MEPTWENNAKMNSLLGIEGSGETFEKFKTIISELELRFVDGKIYASHDPSFPIIGLNVVLNFLDPVSGMIIYHKIAATFPEEKNEDIRY